MQLIIDGDLLIHDSPIHVASPEIPMVMGEPATEPWNEGRYWWKCPAVEMPTSDLIFNCNTTVLRRPLDQDDLQVDVDMMIHRRTTHRDWMTDESDWNYDPE